MQWLNENPGIAQLFSPIIVAVIALLGVVFTHRKNSAVKAFEATIEQLKASNEHLNFLVASLRDGESKAKAANEEAENQRKDLQERTAVNANTIKSLQDEVSRLNSFIAEKPCLVKRGLSYRHAFPEKGDENQRYCAQCLEEDRVLTKLQPDKNVPGSSGRCSRHNMTYF